MQGWKRAMDFDATGLPWVMPSPNMPTLDTAFVYPGLCLVEGTNLSEGRGTTRPFEISGAPFLDGYRWAERLGRCSCRACASGRCRFCPMFQKFARQVVRRRAAARHQPRGVPPVPHRRRAPARGARAGAGAISPGARRPTSSSTDPPAIDLLTGSAAVRDGIDAGRPFDDICASFAALRERSFRASARRICCTTERCASLCSAAASIRRTSRTSWSRCTCSRPPASTSCGSCPRSSIRSTRRSRRSRTGSRCASSRPARSARARA